MLLPLLEKVAFGLISGPIRSGESSMLDIGVAQTFDDV